MTLIAILVLRFTPHPLCPLVEGGAVNMQFEKVKFWGQVTQTQEVLSIRPRALLSMTQSSVHPDSQRLALIANLVLRITPHPLCPLVKRGAVDMEFENVKLRGQVIQTQEALSIRPRLFLLLTQSPGGKGPAADMEFEMVKLWELVSWTHEALSFRPRTLLPLTQSPVPRSG